MALRKVRKNLLYLIPSFHQGGSEGQAVQLAKGLMEDGEYNVSIACLEKDGPLLREFDGIETGEIAEFSINSFYDTKMARQLAAFAKYLRNRKIDIVQSHDFYSNIFGMFGARLARVPVRIAAKRETGMRTRAQLFVERRAMAMSTSVVANSEIVKEYLVRSGVLEKKIEVIYNGLDFSRFDIPPYDRAARLAEFGLPADPKMQFVTIVANLRDPVKDQETFIRAAVIVARRIENAAFVLAGEGPRKGPIEQLAKQLGIGDNVFFLGRCARIPELLAISEIGVLTSISEGFSNSILEYMAAGRPVVATKVGGAAEAIIHGETGFLIRPGDSGQLADHLLQLLGDPTLEGTMGAKGAALARERFSFETQLAKTRSLYERELSGVFRKKQK